MPFRIGHLRQVVHALIHVPYWFYVGWQRAEKKGIKKINEDVFLDVIPLQQLSECL
jgi:hypothetical protein